MIGRLQRWRCRHFGHPPDQRITFYQLEGNWRTAHLTWQQCDRCRMLLLDELSA